jgi:hypothetical protein
MPFSRWPRARKMRSNEAMERSGARMASGVGKDGCETAEKELML